MNKSRNKNQISGTCQKYQSCHSFFSFPAILKKIKKLTISNKIYLILLSGFFCNFLSNNLVWIQIAKFWMVGMGCSNSTLDCNRKR